MVSCAVPNCKNSSAKMSKSVNGITFHRFPRDLERRRQWELSVNREENWCSTVSSTVCSAHFEATDFYLTESGLRRLSVDAVPIINISLCQSVEPTIADQPPIDIKPNDSKEVIRLKYKIRRLEVIAENRKRRLSLMWQSKKRLKRKLEQMQTMVQHLIKNKRAKECT